MQTYNIINLQSFTHFHRYVSLVGVLKSVFFLWGWYSLYHPPPSQAHSFELCWKFWRVLAVMWCPVACKYLYHLPLSCAPLIHSMHCWSCFWCETSHYPDNTWLLNNSLAGGCPQAGKDSVFVWWIAVQLMMAELRSWFQKRIILLASVLPSKHSAHTLSYCYNTGLCPDKLKILCSADMLIRIISDATNVKETESSMQRESCQWAVRVHCAWAECEVSIVT
jgi:hypothetical protein